MKLDFYVHRCVVLEGPAAGNKVAEPVKAIDLEMGTTCEHCGEPMATVEQIVAYMYRELTEQ